MGGRLKSRGPYAQRSGRLYRDPSSGEIRPFGPRDTEWYRNYDEDPVDTPCFRKKFRRRFRCSYVSYLKHVEEVKSSELFSAWMSRDCVGKESSPLSCLFWAVSVTLDEDGASMILKSRRVSVRRHGCR